MAEPDAILKSVESLLADRKALAEREKTLVQELDNLLGQMGYAVVKRKGTASDEGRKPGRPPGSGKAAKREGKGSTA